MSASSKKKLRKEQNAAKMAEKQRKERKEAKKVRAYTISFIAVLLVVALVLAFGFIHTNYRTSGKAEKSTIALTVDDWQLNSVELSYYYINAINNYYNYYYNQFGSNAPMMLSFMGLDVYSPLNEQYFSEEEDNKVTWSQYFLDEAVTAAKRDHALVKAAEAAGYTLPEDEKADLDQLLADLKTTVTKEYGFPSYNDFLVRNYGYGASAKSYEEYAYRNTLANSYYNHYGKSLTYDQATMDAKENENPNKYSSYSFNTYYMSYSSFLSGGTTSEDGKTTTYSDAEKEAARTALKVAAEGLLVNTTAEELDKAIPQLSINKENSSAKSVAYDRYRYDSIGETDVAEWVSNKERQPGDITMIPAESTTENEDGTKTTVINGYTVVLFRERFENTEHMSNVRHLLVAFQNGTTDANTGTVSYTSEQKATAKKTAEDLLKSWRDGGATEEGFIALVKEHTDDEASASTGGLYENISTEPNVYEDAFEAWSIDPARKAGDADIIETSYGYHIMYYVGATEMTYREYLIDAELRNAEMEEWYEALLEPVTTTIGSTKYLKLDLTILTQG